jgi:magnesium-transporting ATPase (P-type)
LKGKIHGGIHLQENVVALQNEDVYESLETSPEGLTSEEVSRRQKLYGPNTLKSKRQLSMGYRFYRNLKDYFRLLLLGASVLSYLSGILPMPSTITASAISAISGDFVTAYLTLASGEASLTSSIQMSYALIAVVLVNTTFSTLQEWRAEKATEALRSWIPEYAKVIRDGELEKVLVEEIVPGDIIVLDEGDRVPADARLIEAYDLWTNNIPLTGESEPQQRNAEPAEFDENSYLYATNLVLMSTSIVKGNAKAVVFATGMNTRYGLVAGLTMKIKDPISPLQHEVGFTARTTFIISLIMGTIFFFVCMYILNVPLGTNIIFTIGVLTALVPEGLQVTITNALAISTFQMLKQNVLVKRLSAVQTLGSVTVIATDKTGTITTGSMTATKIWVPDMTVDISGVGYSPVGEFTVDGRPLEEEESKQIEKLLEVSALCNNAKVVPPSDKNPLWNVIGDTTDGALLVAALKYGLKLQDALVQKPRIHIIPFSSERKMMTSIHKDTNQKNQNYVCTKGSPKTILSICDRILIDGKIEKLTNKLSSFIEDKISDFANQGLRVIAIAYNELPHSESFKPEPEHVENNIVFLGLVAMKDPPRPEIKESLKMAKQAGVKVVVITGDYGLTALAIAREIGLIDPNGKAESDNNDGCRSMITGNEVEQMSYQQIVQEVKNGCSIFALVNPVQKHKIVRALRKNSEIVAVTGDGANDGPSLREAEIGVAMGLSGTDVAREASDMVLLDDSFTSIVKAVKVGRSVYDNLRKFITYVYAHDWAELSAFLVFVLFGVPLPLPVPLLLTIDLCIDIVPSLALSRDPPEEDAMNRPPRNPKERLFNKRTIARSLYLGAIIAVGALFGCLHLWSTAGWYVGMQLPTYNTVYQQGCTMMWAGIVAGQMGDLLCIRTSKISLFKTNLKKNKWIFLGLAWQAFFLAFISSVPFMQNAFGSYYLPWYDWAYLAIIPFTVVAGEELRKWGARRLDKRRLNKKVSEKDIEKDRRKQEKADEKQMRKLQKANENEMRKLQKADEKQMIKRQKIIEKEQKKQQQNASEIQVKKQTFSKHKTKNQSTFETT